MQVIAYGGSMLVSLRPFQKMQGFTQISDLRSLNSPFLPNQDLNQDLGKVRSGISFLW